MNGGKALLRQKDTNMGEYLAVPRYIFLYLHPIKEEYQAIKYSTAVYNPSTYYKAQHA